MQAADLGAHGMAQFRIQVRQRLVEQEHRRLAHQRAPQRDTLALSAGHLPRQLAQHVGHAQRVGCGVDPPVDLRTRHATQLQAEGEILGHGHVRVQRIALEHHRDVAVLRLHVVDAAPADQQVAIGDVLQPGDHPQQRRLAAAGRSHQHHEFAVGDLEAGPVHGHLAVVVHLAHAVELDTGHHCSGRAVPVVVRSGRRPVPRPGKLRYSAM